MSDVNISSPPPAPAAAPSQGEVAINPSPISIPTPVGPQAPPKPVGPDFKGSEHRTESRRETIQRAFERARTDAVPANRERPGMGHNKPPEPMKKEKSTERPPPIDLKKRPEDQPPARPRGEHGHFAAGAQTGTASRQPQPGAQQPPRQAAPPLPAHAPYSQPIARMSPRAKADWPAAPESVRGDMHRIYREFANHYQRMHGDTAVMNTIRHYHQMAQQHGTTLARALDNYVGMENKLRSDPVSGLDVIVSNLNLRTPSGHKITLRDIAWHVLNQTPEQHKMLQTENTTSAIAHQMGQLHQQQQAIAQGLQRLHYERAFSHTRGEVDRFAETHPRLDELGDLIQQELRLGFNLAQAYARADRLRPATHAAQTRTTTAQTRTTDRSISGAPDRGSNGARRQQRGSATARDAVAKAIRQVNGAL